MIIHLRSRWFLVVLLVGLWMAFPAGLQQRTQAAEMANTQDLPPIRSTVSNEVEMQAGIPTGVADTQLDQMDLLQLAVFGVTILVSMAVGWVVGNLLIKRRVGSILRATQEVRKGNLQPRLQEFHGRNEIGQLVQALNEMADTLERREKEHNQADKVQAAIYQITEAAIFTQSMDELYQSIHRSLGELMPVENFYIALYDPASDMLSFPYFVDQFDPPGPPVKAGRGLTEYVLRTGRPLLCPPKVFRQLVQQGEVELVGTDSVDWLGAPLKTKERVIGVMVTQSYTEGVRFSPEDMNLLEFVSTQVALTIERKRSREELYKNAVRAQILAEISRVIAEASLDFRSILDVVVKSVSNVVGDTCVISILSEDREWLQPAAYQHPDPAVMSAAERQVTPRQVRRCEGASCRVAKTGEPVLVQSVSGENRGTGAPQETSVWFDPFAVRSILAVPMRAQGEMTGVLEVTRLQPENPYQESDLEFLQEIGDRTALAILNARLYQQERARSQELDALNSLSSVLRQSTTPGDMIPSLVKGIRSLLPVDSTLVILRQPGNHHGKVLLADGELSPNTGRIFDAGEAMIRTVADTRHPVSVEDFAAAPDRLAGLINGETLGPAAFVPLQSEVELLGLLVVARSRGNGSQPFSQAEIRMLTTIGDLVGNSLRRALLFEETQRRLKRVQSLRKIDVAITNSLDLRLSMDVILEQVIDHTGVDAACVLLYNPLTRTLNYAGGRGFRTDSIQQTSLRIDSSYAGQAVLSRQRVHISDLNDRRTQFLRTPGFAAEGFCAYYALPLIAKGKVKGVLEIFHRSPLDPDQEWLDFLETLAGQAAIAIDNATMFADLQKTNQELTLAYDATIEGWSRALDLRDKETEGHTQRVANMTLQLAQAMGVSEAEMGSIRHGALLHDIGKMGIPDQILLKPGPLTDDEWVLMRKHPVYAYEMLSPIIYLKPALNIPYFHHEKWDGSGYPHGLKGEQIPLAARIFAIVDVWDALTSDRPYRKAWSEEKALEYICEQAGKHFDPQVTGAFIQLLSNSEFRPSGAETIPFHPSVN